MIQVNDTVIIPVNIGGSTKNIEFKCERVEPAKTFDADKREWFLDPSQPNSLRFTTDAQFWVRYRTGKKRHLRTLSLYIKENKLESFQKGWHLSYMNKHQFNPSSSFGNFRSVEIAVCWDSPEVREAFKKLGAI